MKKLLLFMFPLFLFAQVKDPPLKSQTEQLLAHRWYFGITYVPRFTETRYFPAFPIYDLFDFNLARVETELAAMQASFGFRPHSRVFFNVDLEYTFNSSRERSEYHVRYDDPQIPDRDDGNILEDRLGTLRSLLSIKVYLKTPGAQAVSPFTLVGIGKQFAGSTSKAEQLFQTEPPEIETESNLEDVIHDLNSPWLFSAGFGAEYPFNSSLAFFAIIRWDYSRVSATYDAREVQSNFSRSVSIRYRFANVHTRVGAGFNFYF